MDALVIALTGGVGAFISALITWLFARRKNNAEADKSELDVVDKAIEIWRTLAQDLNKELVTLRQSNADLAKQVNCLTAKVEELTDENAKLSGEITRLRQVNNRIVKALKEITSENAEAIVAKLQKEIAHEG
jgi:hypothetical protein